MNDSDIKFNFNKDVKKKKNKFSTNKLRELELDELDEIYDRNQHIKRPDLRCCV